MTIIDLSLLILILAASVLCIYIIFVLKRITKSVETLQNDFHQISEKVIPVLENLDEVSKKSLNIISEAEEQILEIKSTFSSLKNKFSKVNQVSKGFKQENRISDLLKNLNAFSKGVSVFWSKFFSN